MGCVINRGTRTKPAYYGKWRERDGRWVMRATKQPTKAEAEAWVAQVEARIRRGLVGIEEPDPEQVARAQLPLRDLVEKFLDGYSSVKIKDLKKYKREVGGLLRRHVVPTLGDSTVSDLSEHPDRVEALRDRLLESLSRSTVRSILIYTSRAFNWGRKRRLIDCTNPLAAVDKPVVGEQPFDYLSREEVERLLAWAAEHQPDEVALYAVGVYAGLRRGELAGLRWSDVAVDRALLTVARSYRGRTKSGKVRHVPINPRLAVILRQWRERWDRRRADPKGWTDGTAAAREALVFPTERGAMRADKHHGTDEADAQSLPAALAGAKCHAVGLHSLRHTFASHFVMSGGNILTLQRLMGHSSVQVTMRYAHLAPTFMADEVARMSFEPTAAGVVNLADRRPAVPARPEAPAAEPLAAGA